MKPFSSFIVSEQRGTKLDKLIVTKFNPHPNSFYKISLKSTKPLKQSMLFHQA